MPNYNQKVVQRRVRHQVWWLRDLCHSWSPWHRANFHIFTSKRYSLTTKSRDWPWLARAPFPQSSTEDTMMASCSSPTLLLTEFLYRKSLLSVKMIRLERDCTH